MSATKRVTRAQRRVVASQSEDIQNVEKAETESHPSQAEEDISGGNLDGLLVPDEMTELMSARCPEDTDRGGQEEETSCTIDQESPADMPDKPREEILREQDSGFRIPEDDRDGKKQATSCIINQESAADQPDEPRDKILGEDSGMSRADPGVGHTQRSLDSDTANTSIPEDTDRGGSKEEGKSCTIIQDSPADLPDIPSENTIGEEDSGNSQSDVVVVCLQEKPDTEMESSAVPEDTDKGDQEEGASCTINQETPATLPEKPRMEDLFDPKWVELIRLLPEKSDPELELKERDHQVGHQTHTFLYPVPMLPLADSVKQQWEEVNKDLTEDTSNIVPVRREDEKRFWTNNTDYKNYCQSSTIDDEYCTQVAYETKANKPHSGSFIKKTFAIQDPLLHTCENSFKKCDESARMTMLASSHAVLMLNAVESILKSCPSERQSDALPLIEGIQGALECIANTSAKVIARATISRRTICMSQIHHNKPESIKKFLTLPMDTRDLFHGEFKTMMQRKQKPKAKKRRFRPSLDNSPQSNKESSAKKHKLQPPLEKRPKNMNKGSAKKPELRRSHVNPRFDDRDPYSGSYGPPLHQFPQYPHERAPPYPHERAPPYPHERAPRYAHERAPRYPHERAPPYPHERAPPYPHERAPPYPHERAPPYPYDHFTPYPRERGEYHRGHHFGSGDAGRGRFPQKGGSNFTGQKKFKKKLGQGGANRNPQGGANMNP